MLKICCFVVLLWLPGCSVYKASSDSGISVARILKCKNRTDLLACGMEFLSDRVLPNGHYVEIYRGLASKSGINYLRALGHGVLDVATLGVWEVAGTPIEGYMESDKDYVIATVTYPNEDSEQVEKIDIQTTQK